MKYAAFALTDSKGTSKSAKGPVVRHCADAPSTCCDGVDPPLLFNSEVACRSDLEP